MPWERQGRARLLLYKNECMIMPTRTPTTMIHSTATAAHLVQNILSLFVSHPKANRLAVIFGCPFFFRPSWRYHPLTAYSPSFFSIAPFVRGLKVYSRNKDKEREEPRYRRNNNSSSLRLEVIKNSYTLRKSFALRLLLLQ